MKKGVDSNAELQEVRKIPANKKCFDCIQAGTTYAVPELGIFLCSVCGGIHREFNHRVKGLSTCNFTEAEVTKLKSIGNEKASTIWMAKHDPRAFPVPDIKDANRLKDFLRLKYVEKRFYESKDLPEPAKIEEKPEKKLEKSNTGFMNLLDDEPNNVSEKPTRKSDLFQASFPNGTFQSQRVNSDPFGNFSAGPASVGPDQNFVQRDNPGLGNQDLRGVQTGLTQPGHLGGMGYVGSQTAQVYLGNQPAPGYATSGPGPVSSVSQSNPPFNPFPQSTPVPVTQPLNGPQTFAAPLTQTPNFAPYNPNPSPPVNQINFNLYTNHPQGYTNYPGQSANHPTPPANYSGPSPPINYSAHPANYSAQPANYSGPSSNYIGQPVNYPSNYSAPPNYPPQPSNYPSNYSVPSNYPPQPVPNNFPQSFSQYPPSYSNTRSVSPTPAQQRPFKSSDPFQQLIEEETQRKLFQQSKNQTSPQQNLLMQQFCVQSQLYEKTHGLPYPYSFQQWAAMSNVSQDGRPQSRNPFDRFG